MLRKNQIQGAGFPLPMGSASPHLVVPPHHQPLRLSPLPHQAFNVSPVMATNPNLTVHRPGVPPRIPSPRELALHTQSIMQSALIKRKLEEQRENYNRRRRAEAMHQPKQSTFIHTSVQRKMAPQKKVDAQSTKQQLNAPPKIPQIRRPIIKGKDDYPAMGYAPSRGEYQPHSMNKRQQSFQGNQGCGSAMGYAPPRAGAGYQEQYMNQQQQQMIYNIRPFHHQQGRQPPSNFNDMNTMGRGMPGNTMSHQMLAKRRM